MSIALDWAPDGRWVALGSEGQENRIWGLKTAIYLLRLNSGEIKAVVPNSGTNLNPRWSPDGRWVACQTKRGEPRLLDYGRLGLYDTRSGVVSYPAYEELGRMSGNSVGTFLSGVVWSADSRSILVDVHYQMSQEIFRISIPDGTIKRFTTDDDHDFRLVQSDATGRLVFFYKRVVL